MAESEYALGWDPKRAQAAHQEMMATGHYVQVVQGVETPPAFSLGQWRYRELMQGQAGTCWVHAAVALAETFAKAHGYKSFPICRRLVGWEGKQIEGGGNPTNGGAPTDALKSMMTQYAGIAHEDLLPYSDRSYDLGQKPPQSVWEDAKKANLVLPVDVKDEDDLRVMIANKHPVANGTWWPYNFDDGVTFMTRIGGGTYGHALLEMGYVKQGVWPGEYGKYDWWQWDNWHGRLYPPLPLELANLVPGYTSDGQDKVTNFWVRGDLRKTLVNRGYYECVSATDLSGLGVVYELPSMKGRLPV